MFETMLENEGQTADGLFELEQELFIEKILAKYDKEAEQSCVSLEREIQELKSSLLF